MPIAANQHQLSAERVRGIYADSPWLVRIGQSLRPRLYPFEHLVAAVPVGAHVFHAGCGPGLLLGLLALADLRVTGVGFDPNPNSIGYARMMACRVRDAGSLLSFERCDPTRRGRKAPSTWSVWSISFTTCRSMGSSGCSARH